MVIYFFGSPHLDPPDCEALLTDLSLQFTYAMKTFLHMTWPIFMYIFFFRDVLILGVVDAFTCLLAGFAIFSILGYLAHTQNMEVTDVVKEGEF